MRSTGFHHGFPRRRLRGNCSCKTAIDFVNALDRVGVHGGVPLGRFHGFGQDRSVRRSFCPGKQLGVPIEVVCCDVT